ncbi:MAG TPA: hypothetical protein VFJ73_02010 [Bacillales bacterium]|nr:hypothetical protein [Bacillales bacterium]
MILFKGISFNPWKGLYNTQTGGNADVHFSGPVSITAGPVELISQCDDNGFEKLIDEQLDWDFSHCQLSP